MIKPGLLVALSLFSGLAHAGSVGSLNLMSDADNGQYKAVIAMDEMVEYSSFRPAGSNTLRIKLSGTDVPEDVSLQEGTGAVKTLDIKEKGDDALVTLKMAPGSKYQIHENGTNLVVTVIPEPELMNGGVVSETSITSLSVEDMGGVTELTLKGIGLDLPHRVFSTNNNKQVVIDFDKGTAALDRDYFSFPSIKVKGVNVGQDGERIRFVVDTIKSAGMGYQVNANAGKLVLRLGREAVDTTDRMIVEEVKFKPDDRIAHVQIRTSKANPFIHLEDRGDRYVIEIKDSIIDKSQERSMDVSEFPGPVRAIHSMPRKKDTKIVVNLREKAIARTFQSGNMITVTFQPVDMLKEISADAGMPAYSGEKITMNFKDMDIRNALRMISKVSKLNTVIGDDVSGVISLHLIDVPWDQALDIILTTNGLDKEISGNVMRIAPYATLEENAKRREDARQSREMIAPLETEFFPLGHANVTDIEKLLMGSKNNTKGNVTLAANNSDAASIVSLADSLSGGSNLKLMSERGTILMDERTNTLVITDTRERLNNITRLLTVIDRPVRQVMITAHIVEASDAFSRDLGVKWGGSYNDPTGNTYTHSITGGIGGNVVDLAAAAAPGTGGAIGYTLGTLSNALNINLELSAAESEGTIKVVSNPRVLTSNLKEAKIESSKDIPFSQTTFAGGVATTSTVSKQARLTLKVKPQITSDGSVMMALEINKDTPQQNTLSANGDPIIDMKQVLTELLVKSGSTVVIGGIFSETESYTDNGVPGLMDIPLLGNLFKHKIKSKERNELLIFITPTIISNAEETPDRDRDMKQMPEDRE